MTEQDKQAALEFLKGQLRNRKWLRDSWLDPSEKQITEIEAEIGSLERQIRILNRK